ncbi:hypothetical protein [Pleurocapsa sp. PCC 7319]|uniref:hypothetical protein n=1 Tax=Pleurocapsa sp. PCC 7319 TaxID=118161 RepID=UPI000348C04F|nr:hypothetical protein [Pleurocapsa sp. PCC 7319]
MLSTIEDMFSIYSQVVALLGYPQEFDANDNLWSCGIDELAGLIAITDSELNTLSFFQECDRINEAIESLGYEI